LSDILNIILLVLAFIFALGSAAMLVRGLRARSGMSSRAYGVERQEMRHEMIMSFSRGAVLLLIALIVFAIYGLLPKVEAIGSDVTATPTTTGRPTAAAQDTREPSPSLTASNATEAATPFASWTPSEEDSIEIEPTVTVTKSLQATTAVVDSFNGLWLRSAPDPESDQIELVPDESELIVLRGREPSDEPEWQQVRAPSGNEGWVFMQFIVYKTTDR